MFAPLRRRKFKAGVVKQCQITREIREIKAARGAEVRAEARDPVAAARAAAVRVAAAKAAARVRAAEAAPEAATANWQDSHFKN